MNLKCKINGVEYPIVQGATFSEEYNETLDSGAIVISQIPKIENLKPYDDVFIYDKEFNGYPYRQKEIKKQCKFGVDEFEDYFLINPELEQTSDTNVYTSITIYDTKEKIYYRKGVLLSEDNLIEFENNSVILSHYDYDPNHIWINIDFEGQENLVFVPSECYYTITLKQTPTQQENKNTFYKHFLVDQFSETLINIEQGLYKYKIELFSETKGLEVIQLPNKSFTQPRDIRKRKNVYLTMKELVDLYCPKQKVAFDGVLANYRYVNKYILDESLELTFKDTYAPEFTLNNPNLRDILTQFMLTKDMIPYVEDGVIKGLDITQRNGAFGFSEGNINYINSSRSSSNHCDNLRRSYTNALSQDNSCRMVEYLGFRNKDNALLTLDNMRLETRYPIYKINKIYMCYYKTGTIKMNSIEKETYSTQYQISKMDNYGTDTIEGIPGVIYGMVNVVSSNPKVNITTETRNDPLKLASSIRIRYTTSSDARETTQATISYTYEPFNIADNNKEKAFLCKQDITPLVKLNSERALLKEDWDTFSSTIPTSIEDLAKFRLCTVGYNIGDNKIEGWGTKYEYPIGWWEQEKSYIENIYKCVDDINPYGIYQYGYLSKVIGGLQPNQSFVLNNSKIVIPYFNNEIGKYKGLFFQVDYNAFYNGCVVHSKDDGEDTITINDNSSNSLMLLENDGLFQKEKINRFGNKATTINARYNHIYRLQPLGSVYGNDEIIYHREYNIYDNCINCIYYATKDYVLKNYYTSVYAKHRPYNLMSYEESVNRAENKKLTILLSTQPQIKDKALNFEFDNNLLSKIFSFANPSQTPTNIDVFEEPDRINCGLIDKKYLSDVNGFVSGNSLCFNLRMFDNVSGGVYISNFDPPFNPIIPKNDFTGSVQDWYIDVDDVETGFKENMSFELFHFDNNELYQDNKLMDKSLAEQTFTNLLALPKVKINDNYKYNLMSYEGKINKDNKEIIDMTFQIEPISAEPNKIIFSQWMMKLSDLIGGFNKFTQPTKVKNLFSPSYKGILYYGSFNVSHYPEGEGHMPVMMLEFDESFINGLGKYPKLDLDGVCRYNVSTDNIDEWGEYRFVSLTWYLKELVEVDKDFILISVQQKLTEIVPYSMGRINGYDETYVYKLKKITSLGDYSTPKGKVTFSNFTALNIHGWADEDSKLKYHTTQGVLTKPRFDMFQFNVESGEAILGISSKVLTTFFGLSSQKDSESKTYVQNMYLTLSNQEIKKEIVYNEYVELPNKSDTLKVNEVIKAYNDIKIVDGIKTYDNKIVVDLTNIPKETQSIGVWFLDNILYSRTRQSITEPYSWKEDTSKSSYKFVFGVNLTDADFAKGKVEITLSALNNRDFKVYDANHNVIGRIK